MPQNQLVPHPIAEIMPESTPAEYEALKSSIAENGLWIEIMLFESRILDGRHRYRACIETGRDLRFSEFNGTWEEAVKFVQDVNLNRRNHTDAQKALIAAKVANLARGRPKLNPSAEGIISQAKAAEMFGVSVASVERANKVLKSGVPELVDMVESGDPVMSITKAAAIASRSRPEQRRILNHGKDRISSYASKIRVESTLKRAKRSFNICLSCNSDLPATKDNFIANMHFLATSLSKGGSEARECARYVRAMIEELDETFAADEYRSFEERIFDAIEVAPQVEQDLLIILDCGRDELRLALVKLQEYGWIEQRFQEGKSDQARGQKKKLWALTVKGREEGERLREKVYGDE